MAGLSQAEFRDIDEFNEAVQGWDIDFQQVERGGLDAGLTSYPSRLTNLLRVHFSRAIAQSGSSPPGMRTFGLREDTSPWFEWCGREVKADSLLCFHPNSNFECLSRGGFAAFAMSFPETQLVAIAERLGHPDLFDQLCTEEAIDATVSVHLPRLHALLRQAFLDPDASLRNTKPMRSLDLFENSVAEELIMLLVDARCEPSRVSLRSRSRAVKAAMSFILQNAGERLTVSQVCEASGTSWRTLDRAFKEKLGTTPKACINKARLQGARRDLKGAAPTASVADIANKWGFWHLGDFAMNYRREFDELPSETLGKQGRGGLSLPKTSSTRRIVSVDLTGLVLSASRHSAEASKRSSIDVPELGLR